jgi:hypothetical protein
MLQRIGGDKRRETADETCLARRRGNLVEWLSAAFHHLLEPAGRKAGNLLELIGEVLNAAVVEFVGDFAQGQLAVLEQFFDPFDLLQNNVLFDRDAFH